MAATIATSAMVPAYTLSGHNDFTRMFGAAGGAAAYKKGEVLTRNASNLVDRSGADPASVVGIAGHDKGNNWGGTFSGLGNLMDSIASSGEVVKLAHPDNVFEGTIQGTNLDEALMGRTYGIARNATQNAWYVDFAETVATVVRIIGYPNTSEKGVKGDHNPRVYFQFLLPQSIFGSL